MQETIQDRTGARHVADQFAPVLQRADAMPLKIPAIQQLRGHLRLGSPRCLSWQIGAANISIILTEKNHV